ncbi:MAG TPA: hypothetical protein VEP29_04700, partial [Desulfatiglandales bacterium]|nr:hypothetical protein [Desulfatiglandales bacterium]
ANPLIPINYFLAIGTWNRKDSSFWTVRNEPSQQEVMKKTQHAVCPKTLRGKGPNTVTSIHTPALRYGGVYERNLL